MAKYFSVIDEGVVLNVRAAPRSSKAGIGGIVPGQGLDGDAVKVRIRSAPVDGKANKEIIETLSDVFDIPKSRVQFKSGETGKTKRIVLIGMTAAEVMAVVEK